MNKLIEHFWRLIEWGWNFLYYDFWDLLDLFGAVLLPLAGFSAFVVAFLSSGAERALYLMLGSMAFLLVGKK